MGLQRNTTDQREDMSAADGTRGRYDAATAGGGRQVLCPNPAAGYAPVPGTRRERLRPVKSASEMCSPCEQRNRLKTLQTSEDGTFESCVRP